ncbi:LysR family transcriptional regulator [Novosphingobium sp.]|uniref:helix-turn-helix domain-containing protein n=1 Tax=Novosphingobium sp. TaxID=1874826 RepID=UPI0025FCE6D8|nr:LysR family transcriptional regulator [Novosphingobium sp.]
MSEPETTPATAPDYECWTLAKKVAFLMELRATRSVTKAARVVGMSRNSAYRLRARQRGSGFDAAWAAALTGVWPWWKSAQADAGA